MSRPAIRRTYGKRDHAQADGGDDSQRSQSAQDAEPVATGVFKRSRSDIDGATDGHVASSSLLRASGQSMAAAQELDYHFVSGLDPTAFDMPRFSVTHS